MPYATSNGSSSNGVGQCRGVTGTEAQVVGRVKGRQRAVEKRGVRNSIRLKYARTLPPHHLAHAVAGSQYVSLQNQGLVIEARREIEGTQKVDQGARAFGSDERLEITQLPGGVRHVLRWDPKVRSGRLRVAEARAKLDARREVAPAGAGDERAGPRKNLLLGTIAARR